MNFDALDDIHDYLIKTRRDLWKALGELSEEHLTRPLINGERFKCIKDLIFHIPAVTDCWLHEDILRVPPILDNFEALAPAIENDASGVSLQLLLDYWRDVETAFSEYLNTLNEPEANRAIALHDAPNERYRTSDLLWHVLIHEIRHTAQIVMLMRLQNIKPQSLDLLFYLPKI